MPLNTTISVEEPLPFGDRRYVRLGWLPVDARKAVDAAIDNIYQVVEAAVRSDLNAEYRDHEQIENTIDDVIMEAMIRNYAGATSLPYHLIADVFLQALSRALARTEETQAGDPDEQDALRERIRRINRMFDQTVAD